jgi:pimeloyl-ACP methyl ester carboxylesterase
MVSDLQFLHLDDGRRLAYRHVPGDVPEVLFCPGFRSDMEGTKALELESHCRQTGRRFTRFDYTGHGRSSGRFEDGTIGSWLQDTLDILDHVTTGPVMLVGSSMGGWIMLLAALARPARVHSLIGIAAAPDFTEDLIWGPASAERREALQEACVVYEPSDYDEEPTPITYDLIVEGRTQLLMTQDAIPISCPVHLIHGQQDGDVPWEISLRLAGKLASEDVSLEIIKNGGHRLSEPQDIARLTAAIDRLASSSAHDRRVAGAA